jgi:hypothetical protein
MDNAYSGMGTNDYSIIQMPLNARLDATEQNLAKFIERVRLMEWYGEQVKNWMSFAK